MWFNLILVQLILLFISKTYAAVAPFVNKCYWDDSECIKASAQAVMPVFMDGIPSLDVERIDPIKITTLDASSPNLKLILNDITAIGLKGCDIKKMQRDKPKSKIAVKALCTVDVRAQYEMKGHILFVPIEGKGGAHVVLRKIQISVEADLNDKVAKNGVRYWTIQNWKHGFELKHKSTLELENLFNGNEVLGRVARELIASNSNEVIAEVGTPIVKSVVDRIVENVQRFFNNVPAEELEL